MNRQLSNIMTSWPDTLSAVLGILLFLSPWLVGFTWEPNAKWSAHIGGAIIIGLALAELFAFKAWEEWINCALGVWLLFAPWVLGFSEHTAALSTHFIIGLATIILAAWSLNMHGADHMQSGS